MWYLRRTAYLTLLTHSWNLLVTAKIIRKAKNACGKSVYSDNLSTQVNLRCWIFSFRGMKYRKDIWCVDRVHGSALHGGRWAACCEAHTNFADESACLTADNVWNEGKYLTCGPLGGIMLHGGQCGSLWFLSSRQQLSAPLAICSQLQLVRSVLRHGEVYSEQSVFLYVTHVKYGSARKCRRKFRDERVPSRQTIHNLVNKLRTWPLTDKKQKHKRRVLTEKLDAIGARLEHTPRKSLKSLAQENGVSKPSARTATQLLKPSTESWCLVCSKCKKDCCTRVLTKHLQKFLLERTAFLTPPVICEL
jgi:hypothetical protein